MTVLLQTIERQVYSQMRLKANEMVSLDEDLNLFDEDEWDFLNVTVDDENFEFFNDVPDIDFIEKPNNFKVLFPVALLGVLVLISGIWLYNIITSRQDMVYENYKATVDAKGTPDYVDGDDVDSDKLIAISENIKGYVTKMNIGAYEDLHNYCVGKSTLEQSYKSELNQMKATLDEHDSYARMLKVLSKDITCNKIEKAVKTDSVTYVYVRMNVPDKDSINEYVNLYKYNMTKFFTNKEVTQENISEFLLTTAKTDRIPCHEQLYVLEVDDTAKLIDDTKMLGIVSEAYNHCISKMSTILGSGGISN